MVCVLIIYLVLYLVTLPIPPRHTGYLQVDPYLRCSMTFLDVLSDHLPMLLVTIVTGSCDNPLV